MRRCVMDFIDWSNEKHHKDYFESKQEKEQLTAIIGHKRTIKTRKNTDIYDHGARHTSTTTVHVTSKRHPLEICPLQIPFAWPE